MSVTDIPADLVKQLRDETGAGMMECKRALQEADGDLEVAKRLLRERGIAAAGKKAGRETTEGEVIATISGDLGALVAIGCETEPVSKNDEFLRFAESVLEAVEADGSDAVAKLEDERLELIGRLGENIELRGAARLEAGDGELLAEYVHPLANKIGVLVRVRGGDAATARRLAMHISFSAPRYRTADEISDDELASERAIYEQQDDVKDKPEEVRAKIVEGRLRKEFLATAVLAEQPWIHDTSKTVAQALSEEGAEALEFVRYALAE